MSEKFAYLIFLFEKNQTCGVSQVKERVIFKKLHLLLVFQDITKH